MKKEERERPNVQPAGSGATVVQSSGPEGPHRGGREDRKRKSVSVRTSGRLDIQAEEEEDASTTTMLTSTYRHRQHRRWCHGDKGGPQKMATENGGGGRSSGGGGRGRGGRDSGGGRSGGRGRRGSGHRGGGSVKTRLPCGTLRNFGRFLLSPIFDIFERFLMLFDVLRCFSLCCFMMLFALLVYVFAHMSFYVLLLFYYL